MNRNRARSRETLKVLYDYELSNAPGKSIVGVEVTYGPGGWTPPHRHAGATVVALVTEGSLLSGMNGNPPKVYEVGESFREMPGCHHTVSKNNSDEHGTKFIAVFIVDTDVVKKGYGALVEIDDE